ncbi:hypothetical protein QJS83_05990 [Bdellovibrio sp. 22V]|uniref:hypothetical protein n=1 Tax=Bdellovibrio TaxID=958 RepID=UPI002542D1FF|nr:hypothetical protein [Bdellovibrio sp. 22V]WII73418.1 hypothetical protein QJS83_05990 [Bdellovibrio sp. 22V]
MKKLSLAGMGLLTIITGIAIAMEPSKNELAPFVTGAFSDGTTVETLSVALENRATSVIYQIKQTNGVVCYALAGIGNATINNPSVFCVK